MKIVGKPAGVITTGDYAGLLLTPLDERDDPHEGMCINRVWNDMKVRFEPYGDISNSEGTKSYLANSYLFQNVVSTAYRKSDIYTNFEFSTDAFAYMCGRLGFALDDDKFCYRRNYKEQVTI